jgi:aspartate/methionine/tyrosine aminotransferase
MHGIHASCSAGHVASPVCCLAQGMEERDGHPVDTNCLFMTDGASPSVHRIIELLTRNSDDAFLTPIPQYPLCASPPELSSLQSLTFLRHVVRVAEMLRG